MPEIIPRLYKSSTAGPLLCLSVGHLHRLKDSQGGPLIEGKHWFSGPTPNSPIRWDVEAILKVLSHKVKHAAVQTKNLLLTASLNPNSVRLGSLWATPV